MTSFEDGRFNTHAIRQNGNPGTANARALQSLKENVKDLDAGVGSGLINWQGTHSDAEHIIGGLR